MLSRCCNFLLSLQRSFPITCFIRAEKLRPLFRKPDKASQPVTLQEVEQLNHQLNHQLSKVDRAEFYPIFTNRMYG